MKTSAFWPPLLILLLICGCDRFRTTPELAIEPFPFQLPDYYGLYAIQDDTLLDLGDGTLRDLPPTSSFLQHEKPLRMASGQDALAYLSIERRGKDGTLQDWKTWHEHHQLPAPQSPAFSSKLPLTRTPVPMRVRPVAGHNEMILIEPRLPFPPGLYELKDGTRFWIARQQFTLDLVKRVMAASEAERYEEAHDLAEVVKLWNYDDPDMRQKMLAVQSEISQVAAKTAISQGQWTEAEARLQQAKALGADGELPTDMTATVAFLKACDLAEDGDWAGALAAAKQAQEAAVKGGQAVAWPKKAMFRSPGEIVVTLLQQHDKADPATVCEAITILTDVKANGLNAKLSEIIGFVTQEPQASQRLARDPYLCMAQSLAKLGGSAAIPFLQTALEKVLPEVDPAASSVYVSALNQLDSGRWTGFDKKHFNSLYENFQYIRDLGPATHRTNPIDMRAERARDIMAFLRRLGRWDPQKGSSSSGLEFDSRSPVFRIRSRERVDVTYRLRGPRASDNDRYTLILKAVLDDKLPWRIVGVRDIVFEGRAWNPKAAPAETSAPAPTEAREQPAPKKPPKASRVLTKSVGAIVCPDARPMRSYGFGDWYRRFYLDGTLVDIQPDGQSSRKDHSEVRSIVQSGLDLSGPNGAPVLPLTDGIVVNVVDDPDSHAFKQLGYAVLIEHANPYQERKVYSLYAHLQQVPAVSRGDSVKAGKTTLGKLGATGATVGPKLHLQTRFFEDLFDLEFHNIYGIPNPQTKTTFDAEYFRQNWVDPAVFLQ